MSDLSGELNALSQYAIKQRAEAKKQCELWNQINKPIHEYENENGQVMGIFCINAIWYFGPKRHFGYDAHELIQGPACVFEAWAEHVGR